ncbi:hypothetical protein LOZ53_004556 [Ophidiomyces ophidiicola]|nr:hypothetical protein LOZ53_004556 [Ophidiomyces ophidiicola]
MAAATASSWQTTAQIKRESLLALIPEKWRVRDIPPAEQQRNITGTFMHRYLTAREIEITECDAVGVLERTTTGQWSAVEVTTAFCHRAALAHQFVHCLHEIFFEAALDDARRLDAFFAEHQRPMGALHGVPISLKDQFHVRGVETTMWYVGWIGSFQGVKDDARAGVFESELVGGAALQDGGAGDADARGDGQQHRRTSAYRLDNGADAREQFGLSGERLEPFEYVFANTDPPADAQAVAALNVGKRAYQKEYLEYWNASEALTGTGRAVDGVIWPVAPYAAARRDGCYYVGYTSIVNVLDYSAMAIPVTTADAALDARGDGFAPYTDAHGVVHDLYDPQLYDGTPVGLQLVGRRFHEEKLIVLAEYISEVLRGE